MAFPSWDGPSPMSRTPVVAEVVGTVQRRLEGEHRRLRYVSRDGFLFAWTTEPTDDGQFAAIVYKPLTADRRSAKKEGDIAAWSPVEEQRFKERSDAEACARRWYVARVMGRTTNRPPVPAPVAVCGGVLRLPAPGEDWPADPPVQQATGGFTDFRTGRVLPLDHQQ